MSIPFFRTCIGNGLRVIIHRDPAVRMGQVWVGYHVGSAYEKPNITGVAHLLEHLMFEGTERFPQYDRIIQEAGGSSNAFTAQDITCYYQNLPDANLEIALELEADRMLNASLTDEKIAIQKQVVIEEFKERYLNNPYGDVWHLLRALCFEGTPYEWPVIGRNVDELESLQPSDVRSFHQEFYHSHRAVLTVVTARPEEEVLELVYRYFGALPSKECSNLPPPPISRGVSPMGRTLHVLRQVPDSVIYFCWITPEVPQVQSVAADLLAYWLGGAETSLLFERLVRHRPLFTGIQAYHLEGERAGLFVVNGRLARHTSLAEATQAVQEILQEVRDKGIPADRLRRIKKMAFTARAFELTEPSARAQRLLWFELLWGHAGREAEYSRIFDDLTAADLLQFAQQYLTPSATFTLEYEAISPSS
ncbi:MAG: insulinase family protein [Flavobacteriales bacterium]|nr:insulinase family protein [Flavobacteriales bacterium]MDW8410929.1 pitrilysin family protein [Flavobacteriales bacterium]